MFNLLNSSFISKRIYHCCCHFFQLPHSQKKLSQINVKLVEILEIHLLNLLPFFPSSTSSVWKCLLHFIYLLFSFFSLLLLNLSCSRFASLNSWSQRAHKLKQNMVSCVCSWIFSRRGIRTPGVSSWKLCLCQFHYVSQIFATLFPSTLNNTINYNGNDTNILRDHIKFNRLDYAMRTVMFVIIHRKRGTVRGVKKPF